MDRFGYLRNRRQRRPSVAAATLMFLVLLTACPDLTQDAPGDLAATSPPEEVSGSPSPPDKALSARARCRKQEQNAKYDEFVPDTYREGSNVVLPVVFTDGSTAELVYPPRLKLAELGVQPAVSAGIQKGKSRFVHERFLRITKTPLSEFRSDDPPVRTYEGASGKVSVWRAKDPEEFLNPVLMHFRIGTWNIIIGDGNVGNFMGRENRKVWAENLSGHETENGFIVIEPRLPLAFFGGPGDPNLLLHKCFRLIELRLEECEDLKDAKLAKNQSAQRVGNVTVHRSQNGRQFYANWCTPSRQVSVYLDDHNERFVDLAVRTLKFRNVDVNENANFANL